MTPAASGGIGLQLATGRDGSAIVARVSPSGAAAEALKPGDVIVEVNHRAVSSAEDAADKIRAVSPGDSLLFKIQRQGQARYTAVVKPTGVLRVLREAGRRAGRSRRPAPCSGGHAVERALPTPGVGSARFPTFAYSQLGCRGLFRRKRRTVDRKHDFARLTNESRDTNTRDSLFFPAAPPPLFLRDLGRQPLEPRPPQVPKAHDREEADTGAAARAVSPDSQ